MRYIYVDESGNTDLDTGKPSVQRYFVLTGVIVQPGQNEAVRDQAEILRRKHFQTGPFRSNKVGKNLFRRLRILSDLAELPVHFYCMAIDKAEVSRSGGLIHKVPFVKFAHRKFYDFLLSRAIYPEQGSTKIIAEQYGDESFMVKHQDYIHRHLDELFPRFHFEFRDKSDVMLGVTDFLGGSLTKSVDPMYSGEEHTGVWDTVKTQFLGVHEFPSRFVWQIQAKEQDEEHDQVVRRSGYEKAAMVADQLNRKKGRIDYEVAQEIVLRRLMFSMVNGVPTDFVFRDELIRAVLDETGHKIDKRTFNAEVLGKLRNKGVIILASEGGYKLPFSLAEITQWLNFTDRRITPMITRLEVACGMVKSVTTGAVDLLDDPRWAHIRVASEKIRQGSFSQTLNEFNSED